MKKEAELNIKNRSKKISVISYGRRNIHGREVVVDRVDCRHKRPASSVEDCTKLVAKLVTKEEQYKEQERKGQKTYTTDNWPITRRMMNSSMAGEIKKNVRRRSSSNAI